MQTQCFTHFYRGNPGMQSNSVYALAGLAVTINRYGSSLDKERNMTMSV
jgi:hypothetical protein